MALSQLSVTVSSDVERTIRAAAERAGMPVSQWIARTAERAAILEDGLLAVREWEAEHGPISAEADRWARDVIVRAGLLKDEDLRQAS